MRRTGSNFQEEQTLGGFVSLNTTQKSFLSSRTGEILQISNRKNLNIFGGDKTATKSKRATSSLWDFSSTRSQIRVGCLKNNTISNE